MRGLKLCLLGRIKHLLLIDPEGIVSVIEGYEIMNDPGCIAILICFNNYNRNLLLSDPEGIVSVSRMKN